MSRKWTTGLPLSVELHGLRAGWRLPHETPAIPERSSPGFLHTTRVREHSPQVRAAVCEALEFLGITIDITLNAEHVDDAIVSVGSSRVPVLVIRAQENWVVAQECFRVASNPINPLVTR